MTKQLLLALGVLGTLALAGCNLDVPDLNNPGLEQLENAPTAASINTATTGLLVGDRGGKSATTGIVNLLGILGRESYDFDSADGRFVTEMIQGKLSKASPFGGAFWGGNYSAIRLANIIMHGVDKVAIFTDENKQGIRGFAHTLQALELITVILTHDDTGAVIDTDRPLDGPLGEFVKKPAVYAEILRLLDQGKTELLAAGKTFTFTLSPGYAGLNTPPNFLKFNRAIKAKMDIYGASLPGANKAQAYAQALTDLGESFIVDGSDGMAVTVAQLNIGAFHVYSLGAGDQTNGLINTAISAHPSLLTDVQKQTDAMMTPDNRYQNKVTLLVDSMMKPKPATYGDPEDHLNTTIGFKMYTNTSPVPVIRNEELILLKAEALWFTGMKAEAIGKLNIPRVLAGKLPALSTTELPADDAAFIDVLLYERRYSLMFEGGHRWIDLRRFGRPIPLDAPTHIRNVRFPVPQAECDARPGEAACMINSTDPVN